MLYNWRYKIKYGFLFAHSQMPPYLPPWQITPNRNNQQIAKLRYVNYHGTLFSPCLSLCFSYYLCLSIPVNYFWYETRERGQWKEGEEIWHADADRIQWCSEEVISTLRWQEMYKNKSFNWNELCKNLSFSDKISQQALWVSFHSEKHYNFHLVLYS